MGRRPPCSNPSRASARSLETSLLSQEPAPAPAPKLIPEAVAEPIPEPAPVPEPAADTHASTYKVEKGDTLAKIAKKVYGSTKQWKKIADANNIKNPKSLKVGMTLNVPE